MTHSTFERARSASAKHEREEAILRAAATQGLQRGIRAVTLTDIAAGVGMHKSTMLRYFESREEIFLRLAADSWTEWSHAVVADLLARVDRPKSPDNASHAAASLLASSLVARPLFCELLAHIPLNLERGVSIQVVKAFKLLAIAGAARVADALRLQLHLDAMRAANIVATATAMAGALWQMAAPGTDLRTLYDSDPELAHARIDVEPRLTDILSALITGYLAGG